MIAALGWFVVHAVWIGTAIGGLTLVVLGLLRQDRARVRYVAGYAALVLMALLPIVVTVMNLDLITPRVRRPATEIVEGTLGLSTLVIGRAWLVRGAAVLWIAGAAIFLLRVVREWHEVRVAWRDEVADAGHAAASLVSSLKKELGVAAPVSVVRSRRAEVPMVVGIRPARILLPWHAFQQLHAQQLRGVIAHELAHVRRHDVTANILQLVLDAVLWFHPAARWVSRTIRIEREYCCDDVAVAAGVDERDYARALAMLEDARHDCRLVVAAASGTLLHRIERIVGQPRRTLTLRRAVALSTLTIILTASLATLAQVVPPRVPLDARLRTRSATPPAASGAPGGLSLPRSPRPPQR